MQIYLINKYINTGTFFGHDPHKSVEKDLILEGGERVIYARAPPVTRLRDERGPASARDAETSSFNISISIIMAVSPSE